MIKPSIEEIENYFFQQTQDLETSKDDARHFFDYYESCGWMVGHAKKMRAWKPAVNNWIRNKNRFNNERNRKNGTTPNDYSQFW